jgi:hypothetical protein
MSFFVESPVSVATEAGSHGVPTNYIAASCGEMTRPDAKFDLDAGEKKSRLQ